MLPEFQMKPKKGRTETRTVLDYITPEGTKKWKRVKVFIPDEPPPPDNFPPPQKVPAQRPANEKLWNPNVPTTYPD
jgi:hypothetical protein